MNTLKRRLEKLEPSPRDCVDAGGAKAQLLARLNRIAERTPHSARPEHALKRVVDYLRDRFPGYAFKGARA
jgi:hypothetical protein